MIIGIRLTDRFRSANRFSYEIIYRCEFTHPLWWVVGPINDE